MAVNCSGIPETLLESELFGHVEGSFTGAYRDKSGLVDQAEGGTLFLDELGEMSLRMQAVLLRFTETGDVQPVGSDRPSKASKRSLDHGNQPGFTLTDRRGQVPRGSLLPLECHSSFACRLSANTPPIFLFCCGISSSKPALRTVYRAPFFA